MSDDKLREELAEAFRAGEIPETSSLGFLKTEQGLMRLFLGGSVGNVWRSGDGSCITLVAKPAKGRTL